MGYEMDTCLSGDGPLSEAAAMFAGLPPGHILFDIRRRFVERAKRIDTISRAVFPLSFLVFNVFYWFTYKVLRNEDIHPALQPWLPLRLLNFPVSHFVSQLKSSVRMRSCIKDTENQTGLGKGATRSLCMSEHICMCLRPLLPKAK